MSHRSLYYITMKTNLYIADTGNNVIRDVKYVKRFANIWQ